MAEFLWLLLVLAAVVVLAVMWAGSRPGPERSRLHARMHDYPLSHYPDDDEITTIHDQPWWVRLGQWLRYRAELTYVRWRARL